MPSDRDRYPELGPKRRISGPEEALALVRAAHPTAGAEGSTGSERTWMVRTPDGARLVAHHWNPWRRGRTREIWWLRMVDDIGDAPDY